MLINYKTQKPLILPEINENTKINFLGIKETTLKEIRQSAQESAERLIKVLESDEEEFI